MSVKKALATNSPAATFTVALRERPLDVELRRLMRKALKAKKAK